MANTYEALLRAGEECRLTLPEKEPPTDVRMPGTGEEDARVTTLPIEDYGALRQNIVTVCGPHKTKVLLFSGVMPKDGASTVLVNFARCLAAGGERVALVDGNLRNPALHNPLGAENTEGVSELLRRERDPAQLVKATRYKNISLVSAGAYWPGFSCPIEPGLIRAFIGYLRPMADWVLFDSSPINTCNDAVALSSEVDGVVLVVRAEKTRWEAAEHAAQKLKNAGGNIVGVVLNGRRMPIPGWIYRRL
jgi:capsular exopolysaccharide synthesis family protein